MRLSLPALANLMRPVSVLAMAVAGACLPSCAIAEEKPAPLATSIEHVAPSDKPNVLFICVDDLKPLLGCYGDTTVRSPNIDKLAARGVRFDKAYTSQAVCAPSRNALLTGLRPTTIGVYNLGTNFRNGVPDAITMPQHFKANGWQTTSLGKIYHIYHGNSDDPASWSVPSWQPKARQYQLPASTQPSIHKDARRDARGASVESADVADDTYADGLIANEAINRLRQAKQSPDQPFFLMVGFLKPHLPFVAPKKYWDLYKRSDFNPDPQQNAPKNAPNFAPTTWGELRQYSDIPQVGPLDDDQQRELIHGYHAAVSYVDAQIGKVIDELDRLDLSKNTIIVLWGDHGFHLGDHGMWCKHTNYEQANRIPLMMVAPGKAKSGVAQSLVESVDLYPTLCELAGLKTPDGLDGTSMIPALIDPQNASIRAAAFQVFPRSSKETGFLLGRAVRTDRYRLVEWKTPGGDPDTAIFELYDYTQDPTETVNIAGAQPDIVRQLRAILVTQPEAKAQVQTAKPTTQPN